MNIRVCLFTLAEELAGSSKLRLRVKLAPPNPIPLTSGTCGERDVMLISTQLENDAVEILRLRK